MERAALIISIFGVLASGLGAWLAWDQLRKVTQVTNATQQAVGDTERRVAILEAAGLVKSLAGLDIALTRSINLGDRVAALDQLVQVRQMASKLGGILRIHRDDAKELCQRLRIVARASSDAKAIVLKGADNLDLRRVLATTAKSLGDVVADLTEYETLLTSVNARYPDDEGAGENNG